MPNMNGLAFMRELRQMNQQVQILVMTAYDQFSYAQEALRCGARDLFLKPLDRHELEARLRELADELLPASAEEESYSRNNLYTRILDFLDHHFREDIAVQKLAEMFYVNPSWATCTGTIPRLCRRLKQSVPASWARFFPSSFR